MRGAATAAAGCGSDMPQLLEAGDEDEEGELPAAGMRARPTRDSVGSSSGGGAVGRALRASASSSMRGSLLHSTDGPLAAGRSGQQQPQQPRPGTARSSSDVAAGKLAGAASSHAAADDGGCSSPRNNALYAAGDAAEQPPRGRAAASTARSSCELGEGLALRDSTGSWAAGQQPALLVGSPVAGRHAPAGEQLQVRARWCVFCGCVRQLVQLLLVDACKQPRPCTPLRA